MGNRITRTVLFAASALLSMSAFGAGAARFGTLRNADWVVTNAWQAVSNKTHDLIIDMGQEASLPPNWSNVSNAAMSSVQSLQPAYDYSDSAIQDFSSTNSVLSGGPYLKTSFEGATVGYSYSPGGEIVFNPSGIYVAGYSYLTQVAIISENTNGPLSSIQQYGGRFITARQEMENYISTNNPAFVSAVLAAPLVGADPSDLLELAEYGSYGTVGAAILALIAGLAALKRRMTAAETTVGIKLDEESAYPAWNAAETVYLEGSVVSYHGKLWKAKVDILDIAGPPDGAGSAYWDETTLGALKADADALLALTPKYPIVSVQPSNGTLTVAPYTVATYTAGTTAAAFTVAVGVGTAGMARDCELVIDCTATGGVAPTVTWPATFHPRTDAGTDFACEAGVRNVYYISEYAQGQFAVGGWQETAGGNA